MEAQTQNGNTNEKTDFSGNAGKNAHLFVLKAGEVAPQPRNKATEISTVYVSDTIAVYAEIAGGWNIKNIVGNAPKIYRASENFVKSEVLDFLEALELWETSQVAKNAPSADITNLFVVDGWETGNFTIRNIAPLPEGKQQVTIIVNLTHKGEYASRVSDSQLLSHIPARAENPEKAKKGN